MSDDLKERLRQNGLDECDEAIERIEALEADLNTAIAAAYEAAAQVCDLAERAARKKHGEAGSADSLAFRSASAVLGRRIRALTPAAALAARDADRARVRREALKAARNRILGFTMIVPPDSVPMREACESIRGQATRVIRAMIEEEGNG